MTAPIWFDEDPKHMTIGSVRKSNIQWPRRVSWRIILICLLSARMLAVWPGQAAVSLRPVAFAGFDVLADGEVVAPVRLAADNVILADEIEQRGGTLRLSALYCRNPNAVVFAPDDYVSVRLGGGAGNGVVLSEAMPEVLVEFKVSVVRFNQQLWRALFPDGAAPFHFLVCSLPEAEVWHQRGWLNATPKADPFPLLLDTHIGAPEISCKWNRNWSYICPLGAHPIPMIGLWAPAVRHYVGYDFQEARVTDQSERYLATAYCWQQGPTKNFITLAYPHGGVRYGELVYPKGGEVLASRFHLIIQRDLGPTEDPNERFQTRLFARHSDALPMVPDRNDLAWIPGGARLSDFAGPISLNIYGPGTETTFYPTGTVLIHGWTGHREMPIAAAARRGDTAAIDRARERLDTLIRDYGRWTNIAGERCLFWQKPLAGAWRSDWGGAPVTTLHNSDAWYAARVLVELYRYDRSRGRAKPEHLEAIDGLFNWTKNFVWTRNEFADVPSSPFAIGGTLSAAFLLDYYFTFKLDPAFRDRAELALALARNVTWRYLQVWGADSDRLDDALDGTFLAEPNSGRDWAGLACSNEVNWNIDALTQVYVHTGDARMRYYLRGMLQRWPLLYRPVYADSIALYGRDALTEGYGLFDGAGPGRGGRYSYGFTESLPLNEPVGNSAVRVVAGARACIAFCRNGTHSDVTDYRTSGNGACTFRLVSSLPGEFDLSFSYPFVDVSGLGIRRIRDGQVQVLSGTDIGRPTQAPSSIYLRRMRAGDFVQIGTVPDDAPLIPLETPRAYRGDLTAPLVRGAFTMLPTRGNTALIQDWSDTGSFAGLVPGERWAYGIPYHQGENALTGPTSIQAQGAGVIFVAFAPPTNAVLTCAPALRLDNGTELGLSGKPAVVWRGWPPIFINLVLLDYATVPPGRTVKSVESANTLVMAVTSYQGNLGQLAKTTNALAAAYTQLEREVRVRDRLLVLREQFTTLPAGKIAILPGATAGPGANFLKVTGLEAKAVRLTEAQLIDANQFNPTRFPLTIYLNGERYVKTVNQTGDGKAAVWSLAKTAAVFTPTNRQPRNFATQWPGFAYAASFSLS